MQDTVFRWLSPEDYGPQQSGFLRKQQPGTCQWLLNSQEYHDWLGTFRQILFCHGIPGAGKTIMTSVVIDDLCKRYHKDAKFGIAYLYCTFRQQDIQNPDGLFSCLLRQLGQTQSFLPVEIQDLYQHHQPRGTRPSLNEIVRVLHSLLATYSKTYILVDALDELPHHCRSMVLSQIFNLQKDANLSIFATSRPTVDMSKDFGVYTSLISLEIRATEEDISTYLYGRMSELSFFARERPELQGVIKEAIVEAADGMYVLHQLNLVLVMLISL